MKRRTNVLMGFALTIMVLLTVTRPKAQSKNSADVKPPAPQALYNEIAHMDSVLFNAFNKQDLETIKIVFAQDLEFYHDKGGLSGYNESIAATGKLFAQNNGLKRELVKGTMEVYPVPGYGAIQVGSHTFCHMENGKPDCGTFKFLQVWRKRDNEWKLTRVVSYDHR